ncbi:MAG: zinc uptake transcriptional repressor Zur [Idiomarina sp.]|nr:zinc uptake transcriptional repressor Zur [Idiomarina sp.]
MSKKSAEKLLSTAESVCTQRGVRMTPTRREVFSILSRQPGAIGAYDLLDLLKEAVPNAKPPTIYRALDFLQEQGFVHKISSSNSYVLCTHFEKHHPAQMLICNQCGSVQETHSEQIDDAVRIQATKHGFDVQHQTVEAHGVCNNCQTAKH